MRAPGYLVRGSTGGLQKLALTAVHVQGSHLLLLRWLFWGCGGDRGEKQLNEQKPKQKKKLQKNY